MTPMHYELYIDSLFFLNFIMNLYVLMLVNRTALKRAGTGQLLLGAAIGALCFLLPFFPFFSPALKILLGILAGAAGMICIPFRVRSLKMFLKLLERLLLYSFGLGGGILFVFRCLPTLRNHLTKVTGILGLGALLSLLFQNLKGAREPEHCLCRAVLSREGRQVRVNALIDSGNSLTEPVSGKCVSVVDRGTWEKLRGGEEKGFRAIPYHSIGKKHGILPGYLVSRLELERGGEAYVFHDVYVAVSAEGIAETEDTDRESVNMIINPGLFCEDRGGGRRKRQNERHDDSESDTTGQDTI